MSSSSRLVSRCLVQAQGLTFDPDPQREKPVFEKLSLSLHAGEIVALAGANGSGKTTLTRILIGSLVPDAGRLELADDMDIHIVPQKAVPPGSESTTDRLWSAQGRLAELRRQLEGEPTASQWDCFDEWQRLAGYEREAAIDVMAHRFGIDTVLSKNSSELSPGQLRKVDLAAALASTADLLVFDEPLNDLDLQGITAFEDVLLERQARSPASAVLLISHDRELLDVVAERTLLMTREGLLSVSGGYSTATDERERRSAARAHRADEMRKTIARLEREFRQRASWAMRKENSKRGAGAAKPYIAKRAKKMMKRAKEVEKRHDDQLARLRAVAPRKKRPVKIEVPDFPISRRGVLRCEGVSKSFGETDVLVDLDLQLDSTSRLALLGSNGAGKSTLLALILGRSQPTSGTITRNSGVPIGFLPQGLRGLFDGPRLLDSYLGGPYSEADARTMLGSVGLRRERVLQSPETLSMGERMRAALVRLMLERCEFLLLDEPTSHLDIESIEVLETVLEQYPGGFLLVSHDRRLVSNVAREIVTLEQGRLVLH